MSRGPARSLSPCLLCDLLGPWINTQTHTHTHTHTHTQAHTHTHTLVDRACTDTHKIQKNRHNKCGHEHTHHVHTCYFLPSAIWGCVCWCDLVLTGEQVASTVKQWSNMITLIYVQYIYNNTLQSICFNQSLPHWKSGCCAFPWC